MNKKEEHKITKDLSYYGEGFQYKLLRFFIENPQEFTEVAGFIHPTQFSNKGMQSLLKVMLEIYEKKSRPGNWKELEYKIKENTQTEEDLKEIHTTYSKVKEADTDAIDEVGRIGMGYLKLQEIKRLWKKNEGVFDKNGYDMERLGELIEDLRSVEKKSSGKCVTPCSLYDQIWDEGLEERITTGVPELDEKMNGGLPKGTLGLLIAGTGVGKTTFMSHMAAKITVAGYDVLYIYFEDKETDMVRKAYATISTMPVQAFRRDNPNYETDRANFEKTIRENKDFARVLSKEGHLRFMKLTNAETTIEELKSAVRSEMRRENWRPDIIFLDYIGCVQSSSNKQLATQNEFQTLDRAMKKLDAFAQEEGFSIWVAQQTNRNGAKMDTKSDRVANVQGSYRITQTANVILYLERNNDFDNDYNSINLYLDKNRGGELAEWTNAYLNNGTCQLSLSQGGPYCGHFDPDKAFGLGDE